MALMCGFTPHRMNLDKGLLFMFGRLCLGHSVVALLQYFALVVCQHQSSILAMLAPSLVDHIGCIYLLQESALLHHWWFYHFLFNDLCRFSPYCVDVVHYPYCQSLC
jgi:hypothetical protein